MNVIQFSQLLWYHLRKQTVSYTIWFWPRCFTTTTESSRCLAGVLGPLKPSLQLSLSASPKLSACPATHCYKSAVDANICIMLLEFDFF